MEIKIIEKEILKGKLLKQLDVNYSVLEVLKTPKKYVENLLRYDKGDKYFDKPINSKIYITYPLSVIVEIEVNNINNIGELLYLIAQAYNEIYKEEKNSSTIKEGNIKGMMNRNETNGKYGIWGHSIEDLFFECVQIYDNNIIHLCIGS